VNRACARAASACGLAVLLRSSRSPIADPIEKPLAKSCRAADAAEQNRQHAGVATAARRSLESSRSSIIVVLVPQTLLSEDGNIPEGPLLHPIDEELLEEAEVREGSGIERTERVPCTIALAKVHRAATYADLTVTENFACCRSGTV